MKRNYLILIVSLGFILTGCSSVKEANNPGEKVITVTPSLAPSNESISIAEADNDAAIAEAAAST